MKFYTKRTYKTETYITHCIWPIKALNSKTRAHGILRHIITKKTNTKWNSSIFCGTVPKIGETFSSCSTFWRAVPHFWDALPQIVKLPHNCHQIGRGRCPHHVWGKETCHNAADKCTWRHCVREGAMVSPWWTAGLELGYTEIRLGPLWWGHP